MDNNSIDSYWSHYQEIYGFEKILAPYRQKKIHDFLRAGKFTKILEIGCGFLPSTLLYDDFVSYVAVEPGKEAYDSVALLASGDSRMSVHNAFFEEVVASFEPGNFDAIILPGVLHEIETPREFLALIRSLMGPGTSLYVNVPNANSLHRILGEKIGLIQAVTQMTDRNISLGQNTVFTVDSLKGLLSEAIPTAELVEAGTFFIKPFTHAQMMALLDCNVFDESIFDGLYDLAAALPDFGCEIYATFELGPKELQ